MEATNEKFKYEWQDPSIMNGVDPQKAGEYLDKLGEFTDGKIDPQILVNEARNPRALLHKAFEWDNTKAAEEYRYIQAQKIINNVVKVRVIQEKRTPSAPVKVKVKSEVKKQPKPISMSVISGKDKAALMPSVTLINAIQELAAFKKKYASIHELKEVFDAIDKVKSEIKF